MSIYSSVDACEELGSAQENYAEITGIMTASVTLRCAWADRHALAQDVVGNKRQWPKGGFVLPLAHSAAIVPVPTPGDPSQDGQEIIYGQALVTINYSSVVTDLVSHSIEPTAEFITLDYRRFRWGAADGLPLSEDEAPGYLLRGMNLVVTELEVIPPLSATLLEKVGKVNNAALSSSLLGLSFAEETLLYAPPSITMSRNSLGQVKCQIVKKFTYKPQGWNKYFKALTNSWESIYIAGGAEYKSYEPTSLAGLLS